MATHLWPTDHVSGPCDEGKPKSLRRSLTRLPITTRIPKEHVVEEPKRPQPTLSSPRHVHQNGTPSSRTLTNSRLQPKNVPASPSVVHAQPSSATPSIQTGSSKARPLERRFLHPPPSSTKTPSLVSGSTISSQDSPHSVLRRKASTINQYARRAKTDPESMQEHQDLVDTVHKAQFDDDPFPGAILGMTLPSASDFRTSKIASRIPSSDTKSSNLRSSTNPSRPTVELRAPFTDAASSRHSDSPCSHQSTPTSATSYSSVAASSPGSTRHRDSLDLVRSAEKTHSRHDHQNPATTTNFSLRKEATKPRALNPQIQANTSDEQKKQKLPRISSSPFKSALPHKKESSSSASTSQDSTSSQAAAPVRIPPEFAHLNVEPMETQLNDKPFPPRRPSRDGIDGLGLPLDVPVVQSNLAPGDLSHIRRMSSQETSELMMGPPPQSPRRTFGFSHRSSSRQSTRSQSGNTCPATPKTPVGRSEIGTPLSRKDSPMIVPSPSTLRSPRVGILPKRPKTSTPPIKPEKPKKGPAAGTGHEGYGKFGFRGRGSNIFGGKSSRSSSKDSSTSRKGLPFLSRKRSTPSDGEDDMDHFLDQRREPIILRGNGSASKLETLDPMNRHQDGHIQETTSEPHPDNHTISSPSEEKLRCGAEVATASLSQVMYEGKEGHWLSSSTSTKSPTFMQRFKSRITNQNPSSGPADSGAALANQYSETADRTNITRPSDIQRLASGNSQLSGSSSSSDNDMNFLIPYDRRHEGLLPPPPSLHPRANSFESPVLLKAKTATSAKAPHPVDIQKGPALSREDNSKARLRSVGRIPQVVRAGQSARPQTMETTDSAARGHSVDHGHQEMPNVLASAGNEEFLAFPPRKNSELSYTSSSGLGSPCIVRTSFVGEDEVWNEYDNLIDEVLPSKVRASAISSLGAPFQYGDMVELKSTNRAKEQNAPRSLSNPETGKDPNLDASRPSTTFSISDYLVDHEETNDESFAHRSSHRDVAASQVDASGENRRSELFRTQSKRASTHPKQSKPVENSASVELRFAALMTSKWLSFGRLLFSPAHEEANSGNHTRILILDGLGRDWSYNCALTYPKCQFYNLSPEPFLASRETLANYHHIPHASISTPFPFPNNYFSAVVFRFPVAAADDAYQSCFNEIKRTLRPSGYLEMSVLDLDLVNMGSIARKTVRDLKIRIHQSDSQISLWNHGDAFLTLLGRRDFANIQRCVVGIPVAGRIRRSQDSSSSSSGNELHRKKRWSDQEPEYFRFTEWMQTKGRNNENDEDEHHERRNDEDITKTVAKIGRWWYSSCYPDPGAGELSTGVWDTHGLLRECERQRTSFRLLFCYAQKPVCVKRRTASV